MLYFNPSLNERVIVNKNLKFGLVEVRNRKKETYITHLTNLTSVQ